MRSLKARSNTGAPLAGRLWRATGMRRAEARRSGPLGVAAPPRLGFGLSRGGDVVSFLQLGLQDLRPERRRLQLLVEVLLLQVRPRLRARSQAAQPSAFGATVFENDIHSRSIS